MCLEWQGEDKNMVKPKRRRVKPKSKTHHKKPAVKTRGQRRARAKKITERKIGGDLEVIKRQRRRTQQ